LRGVEVERGVVLRGVEAERGVVLRRVEVDCSLSQTVVRVPLVVQLGLPGGTIEGR
jgi:hypothetical protein